MTVTLRFDLVKDAHLAEMRFLTSPRRQLTLADRRGYYVTTAQGPDLFKNAQQAVRYMLDHLTSEYHMTREQAYCLCGAAVDLKISQIVDAPNFMVSAYLPLSIFIRRRSKGTTRRPAPRARSAATAKTKARKTTRR